MAVSRTLEPDPGYAGVGTEQGPSGNPANSSHTWISMMTSREIAMQHRYEFRPPTQFRF
jgi:hypothetical protein